MPIVCSGKVFSAIFRGNFQERERQRQRVPYVITCSISGYLGPIKVSDGTAKSHLGFTRDYCGEINTVIPIGRICIIVTRMPLTFSLAPTNHRMHCRCSCLQFHKLTFLAISDLYFMNT